MGNLNNYCTAVEELVQPELSSRDLRSPSAVVLSFYFRWGGGGGGGGVRVEALGDSLSLSWTVVGESGGLTTEQGPLALTGCKSVT